MKLFDWGLEDARANGSICVLEYEDGQAFVVAEVFGEVGESPTEIVPSHDRARLIAAAPDLHEALTHAIGLLEMAEINDEAFGGKDDPEYVASKGAWDRDLGRFRAALAKANGGPSHD